MAINSDLVPAVPFLKERAQIGPIGICDEVIMYQFSHVGNEIWGTSIYKDKSQPQLREEDIRRGARIPYFCKVGTGDYS